jgi:dienelactone hydrolase
MTTLLLSLAVLVAAGEEAADTERVFDVAALTSTPLHGRTIGKREDAGIVTEQVRFHSETDGDKDVDIFAFFSYPKGGHNLPAFIWNQGGLSQASPDITQTGARRGYATLCIDFPQPGYRSTGNYPVNAGLDVGSDPRRAPIYHGAVALLKAVSYLESRPEVDKDRIGMAGSSWGGFFTTLMIGIDRRLKAGSCFYGTGNLQLGNAWWDGQSRNGRPAPTAAERERWRTTLDPAWRLPRVKTPIAWFTGTNDGFYLLSSVMKSYDMAAGPKHLTLLPNWDHAMPPHFLDQVLAWLDIYLHGKPSFPRVTPLEVGKEDGRLIARWSFQGEGTAADLIASYGPDGNWRGRYWHTFKAEIQGHTCQAEVPAGTLPCYLSGTVINKHGFRSSTRLLQVDPAALGLQARTPVPDYDGCAEWGGFEPAQLAYLTRHDRSGQRRWIPRLSSIAKEGKQSAILQPGRTYLPPILGTATVRHRLACFLKAEKPLHVRLQLAGVEKDFAIGTEWTEISMEYTPPVSVMGEIRASITTPPGSTLLLDAVTFRPVFRKD